jgi:hypothetical protein
MHRPLLVSSIALTALLAARCGSSPTTLQNHDGQAFGGSQPSGGASAAGGSLENGGASGTGGVLATGGASGTGGMEMAGGTTAAGGARVIPTGGSASGGSGAAPSGGTSSGGIGGSSGQGGVSGRGGAGGAGGAGSGLPWLKVVGNQIQVEATGAPVILRGLSIEGLDQQSKDSKYNINGVIDLITNKNDAGGSSPGWYPVLLRLPVDSSNPSGEINGSPDIFVEGALAGATHVADGDMGGIRFG